MSKLVDISNAHIPKGFFEDLNVPKLFNWLESLPRVDVVRCRDCKYYQKDGYFETMLCMHKDIPVSTFEFCPIDEPFFVPDEDFYCALGEKEDDPV